MGRRGGVKITNDDELRCIKRQREKERKIRALAKQIGGPIMIPKRRW